MGVTDEAIPVLHVSDAARAVEWYRRLGYEEEWTHRFEPGLPAFVSLARSGSARLFLSEHQGDASPDTLVYLRVSDVDDCVRTVIHDRLLANSQTSGAVYHARAALRRE